MRRVCVEGESKTVFDIIETGTLNTGTKSLMISPSRKIKYQRLTKVISFLSLKYRLEIQINMCNPVWNYVYQN